MFPKEHMELMVAAKAAIEDGSVHGASWWIFKDEKRGVTDVNSMRQHMTDSLGSTIYDLENPRFANIGLGFYHELAYSIGRDFGPQQVLVRLKGGNAAAFMMGARYNNPTMLKADGFEFGDLDIDVLINPKLHKVEFDRIQATVKTVIGQTLARHKRRLDKAFFKPPQQGDPEEHYFFDNEEQKQVFARNLCSLVSREEGAHCSLSCDLKRNQSSNISYLITNSDHDAVIDEGNKRRIKIEQPHLDKAERVPLKFSPLYITVNDTIKGSRTTDEVTTQVSFTLSRMKLSNLVIRSDGTGRVRLFIRVDSTTDTVSAQIVVPYEKVSSDFIDVWVGNQEDGELIEFEKRGGFQGALTHVEHVFDRPVLMPTLVECAREYYKLLHVYDCPESKRERRERKFAAIDATLKAEEERLKQHRLLEIQRVQQIQYQQTMHKIHNGPGRYQRY